VNNPLSFIDPTGLDYGFDCGDNCVGVVGTTDDPVNFDGPTRTTPMPLRPPGNGPVRAPSKPTLLHIAACAVAAPVIGAAQASNRTVGVGVGGSAGAGFILGLFASAGVQIVADPQGNTGLAFNINTSTLGAGIGAQGGGQFSLSTAKNINALSGGPSGDLGGSGWIIGLDASHTPGGPTTGTITFGPGVGGKGAALTAGYTAIPVSTNCSDLIN
jgi:hypothetical protein